MDPIELEVRQKYPQMAWAITHPELGPMLRQAVTEGWDPARLQGALLNTAWYKATADAEREWDRLANENPAEASKRFNEAVQAVQRMAAQLGVTIDSSGPFSGQAGQIAAGVVRSGWDQQRVTSELLARVGGYRPDAQAGGQLGANVDTVKSIAASYLATTTDQQAWDFALKMSTGELDQNGIQAYFKDLAVARWGDNAQMVDMLNRGVTPLAYFQPHIQQVASLLERSPQDINLLDPKFSAIIQTTDDKGNIRPMTLSETAKYVRGLDEFRYTDQANQQVAELAQFLGEKMGRVA